MVKLFISTILILCVTYAWAGDRLPDDFAGELRWSMVKTSSIIGESAFNSERKLSDADRDIRRRSGEAFRKSLLLPGWGQFSTGSRVKGYVFAGIEATLITGIISTQVYGNWLEDDYQAFAAQHAGVGLGRPHQFYVDMGNWMNQREYNEQRLRDRDFEALYNDDVDYWNWDSEQNRLEFKDMRIAADTAKRMTVFLIGGMIVNHLASAIDAARGTPRTTISVAPTTDSVGGMVNVKILR